MKSKLDFTPAAKEEIRFRSKGQCEACTPVCTLRATVFHHILGKGQRGKGVTENGLHLCDPCHKYIHANPAISYEQGWMRRSGPLDNQRPGLER